MMADDDELQQRKTIHQVKLNEKPCAVEFVKKFDGFIVATYDCLPDISSLKGRFPTMVDEELAELYEHTNHRIGSLNFLHYSTEDPTHSSKPQVVHSCRHGGIFDMSIIQDQIIYAAHANGHVAQYHFDGHHFEMKSSIKITTSPGALLTSIDTCEFPKREKHSLLALVGDSAGCITILSAQKLDEIMANTMVTENGDPVWQLKFVPAKDVTEHIMVLVAAEDSSWYIYRLEVSADATIKFNRIHANQDFKAGVTSICFIPPTPDEDVNQLSCLIGSYDETIRYYRIQIDEENGRVRVENVLDSPILIAGGGVWRLNLIESEYVYIAAMYAGTYRLEVASLRAQDRAQTIKCDNIIESYEVAHDDNKLAPLHYGVDLSCRESLACIVDYNNNSCIFLKLA